MHIDSNGWVSVAQLIIYVPAAILSIFVCVRHGFTRSSGWIYTLLLCIVRIAGSICQLLTYSNTSTGLIEAALIFDTIAIGPLLFATLGLLSRLVDWVNVHSHGIFTTKHFHMIRIVITVGIILSIIGGTSENISPDGQVQIQTTSKVAVILFVVTYIAITLVLLTSIGSITKVPHGEKRIGFVVLCAMPFIAVRILYSTLSIFVHNHWFNIVNGDVPVRVCMAVAEEVIVVFMYLLLGLALVKLDSAQQGPILSRPWKAPKRGRGNQNYGLRAQNSGDNTKLSASDQGQYQNVQREDIGVVAPALRAYSPGHAYRDRNYGP